MQMFRLNFPDSTAPREHVLHYFFDEYVFSVLKAATKRQVIKFAEKRNYPVNFNLSKIDLINSIMVYFVSPVKWHYKN
jgi:hypothetical protein